MSVPCESTAHSHDCSCHDCTAYSHDSPQTPRLRSITTILLNLQFYISGCIYNSRCRPKQTFPWSGLTCSQSFWRPPWRQTPNRPRSRDCSRDAATPRCPWFLPQNRNPAFTAGLAAWCAGASAACPPITLRLLLFPPIKSSSGPNLYDGVLP